MSVAITDTIHVNTYVTTGNNTYKNRKSETGSERQEVSMLSYSNGEAAIEFISSSEDFHNKILNGKHGWNYIVTSYLFCFLL